MKSYIKVLNIQSLWDTAGCRLFGEAYFRFLQEEAVKEGDCLTMTLKAVRFA